jgi:glucose/arabinose dehydrogenase
MRRSISTLALAVLALAGCTSTPAVTTTAPSAAAASALAAVVTPMPTPTPTVPLFKAFGQRWTYGADPGIGVVAIPKGAKTATADASPSGAQVYVFDLQISNGTSAALDPTTADVTVTYGATGLQAARVFDPANGWDNQFTGVILPSQMHTVTEAYAIPTADLGNVTMTFTPGVATYGKVVWSGPLP